MRNTLKKMAKLTYAELIQGRESTHLPHTHKFTSLKNVVISALHKIDKRIQIQMVLTKDNAAIPDMRYQIRDINLSS